MATSTLLTLQTECMMQADVLEPSAPGRFDLPIPMGEYHGPNTNLGVTPQTFAAGQYFTEPFGC